MNTDFGYLLQEPIKTERRLSDFIDEDTGTMRRFYRGAPITYGYRWER